VICSEQNTSLPAPQNGTERTESSEKVRVLGKQCISQKTQRLSLYGPSAGGLCWTVRSLCAPSAGPVSYSSLYVWALSGVCVGQSAHCERPQRGLCRTARSLCGPSAGSVSDSPLSAWALSGVCVGQPAHCIGSACSRYWPVHFPSFQS